MDRNSIFGLLIIGALIVAYSIYTQPSKEELQARRQRQDSIAAVMKAAEKQREIETPVVAQQDTVQPVPDDSTLAELNRQRLGDFSSGATGTEQIMVLENDLISVSISSLGGRIKEVVLKNYKTYNGDPVRLMGGDSSVFNITLPSQNRVINTQQLYFTASGTSGAKNSVSMKLSAGEGKYLEYLYELPSDSYLLNYKINLVGLENVVASNASYLNLDWKEDILLQEKSIDNERAATTVYYRFSDEEIDDLGMEDAKENLKTKVKWVAFKQQFFTTAIIADNAFDSPVVESVTNEASVKTVKTLSASFSLPFERKADQSYAMSFYFGPNHYQTLRKVGDLGLEKLVPLGWGIFGWVNKFLVIPTFNFLNSLNLNFGIIILLLTIMVRIVLLPFTYGSFKSQAKMKVLQPEMAEINEKFGDDPMKKQQEVMGLYKKAGVNPLGGCIPGLLQLPILIAMFNFFPSSIELRQESFLWAEDLSTYDSILDLPFKIPFYGDHVSLFTLLMTISTIIYTRINMQMTTATNPQMKWMMYLMPVLFLGFFNNYSAGLSYYYFLSNIIGFGQQYLFKAFIDEDKIHAQIQENKKKPVKKSAFQQRLEKIAKERGIQPPPRRR